jgi:hypothetical protein
MTGRALFLGLLISTACEAAGDQAKDVALEIKRIADAIRTIRANPSLDQDDQLGREIAFANRRQRFFLVYAILRDQFGVVVTPAEVAAASEPDLAAVEQARTDVQAGATNSASGSSSLISKGSGPSYFAAAVENGAFVKSASATTTTFQGNVVGILDTMSSKGYLSGYSDDAKFTRFLRRFSFAFTIRNSNPDEVVDTPDTSGGGTTAAIRRQIEQFDKRLEQYSFRAIVGKNRRDPRDEDNRTALRKLMDTQGQAVLAALDDALTDLQISDEYTQWIAESVKELKTVPLPLLEGALVRRLNLLCDLAKQKVTNFQSSAVAAYQAYAAFLSARSTVLENIEKRFLLSFEYVNTRQNFQADLSTYRFIGEGQKGRWDLTFNGAYTAYNTQPLGGGSLFRDFQFAAEADRALGNRQLRGQSKNPLGNAVLAIGFLYERLSESATVTFGGRNLVAPPGNLYIGQLRVTLPMSNSGVKLPLSVSISNRTELLNEKQVRANLGFTFNFDAVASLFKK